MKITMNMDCTPEEARTFLGLPDVKPMQEQMMAEISERMSGYLHVMDPQEMMKFWMPGNFKGLEQLQEMFAQLAGARAK